jgi:4-amino-4-deoxy-L-arabinose transferase-like glycosyltransferase
MRSFSRYNLPRLNSFTLTLFILILLVLVLYVFNIRNNPPGFYIDESSISYNAYTIASTGRDEFGNSWPLFFRAFGDYKNPVYIYLLAGLFKLTGPSILVARLLSATSGIATGLLLGLLAFRITRQRSVGLLVTLFALLTPWLFELSRVVVEVALYPLVITLFLLCVHRASTKVRWSWREAVCMAGSLTLVTYTYSIGRLFGPLLAVGLVLFASRARRVGLVLTWSFYALTLIPLAIFQQRHPGALMGRFNLVTYITPQSTYAEIAGEFIKHYLASINPWKLLVTGDLNPAQMAHLHGSELFLCAAGVLAVTGLWLILRLHLREAWWRFIIFGLVVAAAPASLTKDFFHMLRLVPLLAFLLVLVIPAIEWLLIDRSRRRTVMAFLVLLAVIQGAAFQWRFHASADSMKRRELFNGDYPAEILARAVASDSRPIYLADVPSIPGYIQAYWYATLYGLPLSDFILLPPDKAPPLDTLVIATENSCPRCQIIATSDFYTLYVADQSLTKSAPLHDGGFRASISVNKAPAVFRAGQIASLLVRIRNEGNSVWLASGRGRGLYQVNLGNHWLQQNGQTLTHDDGRSTLPEDLKPGEARELTIMVATPRKTGKYLLELDMVQEGVTWFGPKGSQTLRIPVTVE